MLILPFPPTEGDDDDIMIFFRKYHLPAFTQPYKQIQQRPGAGREAVRVLFFHSFIPPERGPARGLFHA